MNWIGCSCVAAEFQLPVMMLMGPTASGKTGLSLELSTHLPLEIISVDSAQVYRGMDIGTAKLDALTRARIPHHLVDILDPVETYSAARFCEDALRLIAEIRQRGRMPLLVGGTMLYFRALQQGLSALPSADSEFRLRLEDEAMQQGWPAMHARLAQKDPTTGDRLHPNDQQRISRALEIIELTGMTPTEFYAVPKSACGMGRVIKIGLHTPQRAELHARIETRFRQMMQDGFLEEVTALRQRGDLHADLPAIRAVGYRQMWDFLSGIGTLDQAVQRGIAATRQFAKRQLTWLRTEKDVHWLDPAAGDLVTKALALLK